MVTIAALFIVAAGLNQTGILSRTLQPLLGNPRSALNAQARIVLPVASSSAFLNNTPIVAMLMPLINDWAKRSRVAASQLLMPLSYAAILGGLCTLIGTSTNLVVHGMMLETPGMDGLRMFDISPVGIPLALIGIVYVLVLGRWLLPTHHHGLSALRDPREYTIEMVVVPGGPLEDSAISEAGLRHLPGVFLMEIHRHGHVLPAVGPDEVLEGDDQLIFVGLVDSLVDLQRIPGLRPATEQLFKLDSPRSERRFVEAVISRTSPIVGKTIRDGRFRNRYNAVVIGVARNGQRIRKRIGDIVVLPGDVLLLEALPNFVEQHRNSSDFYLVSGIEGVSPPRHDRGWVALGITVVMVVLASTGVVSMLRAALGAAALMLITRCVSEETARRRIDWQLLIAIAAAFGLGNALTFTGAASAIAHSLLTYAGDSPVLALAAIYGVAMVLSALITNNATAVVVFPIAVATAAELDVNYMPFIIGLMVASSTSFATGGYRFRDFVRFGLPLSLLLWVVSMWLIPRVWPF
jgi:di/tricarboxylate transporter